MVYKIELTQSTHKDFSCLDTKTKVKTSKAIDMLADFSPNLSLNIKKLKTPFGGYRARVGDYRLLFVVVRQTITIYSIKHRKNAYK